MAGTYVLDWATTSDHDDLADLVFDAVRNGPSPYTEAEREQWMPRRPDGRSWTERLDRQVVAIARDDAGVAGFMSLDQDGCIDLAHIRPHARGNGLFGLLFDRIEHHSARRGDRRLWVLASAMAEPAFASRGFVVIERQIVRLGQESLARAKMERISTTD